MNKNRKKILSLWMSSLVAVFGLTAGCSPGGSTDDEVTIPAGTSSGTHFLFSSQYDRLSVEDNGAWTKTKEGGLVYVAPGYNNSGDVQNQSGDWDWGWYEASATDVATRQSYVKQWNHDTALDSVDDRIYVNVKAPTNSKFDISETDTLVIQTGNASDTDSDPGNGLDAHANTHNTYTLTLQGGTQASDYSWSNVCTTDQPLTASGNKYGLSTYYVALSSFNCTSGSLSNVKSNLAEVMMSVEYGKNASADNSTSNNTTALSLGFIGFTKDGASSSGSAEYVLFASSYGTISGAVSEPYIKSKEGGDIYGFSGGNFSYAGWGVTSGSGGIPEFQSYGAIFQHTSAVSASDYFGWTVKGPNNSTIDASNTSKLVLQVGNAQDASGNANSHMVFVVDIKDNSSSNLCSYDLNLTANSRPGQSAGGFYGLQTYYIDLSSFSCSSGSMSALKPGIAEVAIKVVGGKDTSASASTANNATYPVFGLIAFSK